LKKNIEKTTMKEIQQVYGLTIDESLPIIKRYSRNITRQTMKIAKVFQFAIQNYPKEEKLINFIKECATNLLNHDHEIKNLIYLKNNLIKLKQDALETYNLKMKNFTEKKLLPYNEK
jgi:hypothetical protein